MKNTLLHPKHIVCFIERKNSEELPIIKQRTHIINSNHNFF